MFSFWKKESNQEDNSQESMQWDKSAINALAQAVSQAPVPGMMKQKVKHELENAAEEYARNAGKTTVSAEDLMNGLMAKLPENMRKKVEDAAKNGPEGLKNLQNELK